MGGGEGGGGNKEEGEGGSGSGSDGKVGKVEEGAASQEGGERIIGEENRADEGSESSNQEESDAGGEQGVGDIIAGERGAEDRGDEVGRRKGRIFFGKGQESLRGYGTADSKGDSDGDKCGLRRLRSEGEDGRGGEEVLQKKRGGKLADG